MVEPGLWESLKGLKDAKEIIERRVILPLAEPQLAARHAVFPPSAIVLFGPPGRVRPHSQKGLLRGWRGRSSRSSRVSSSPKVLNVRPNYSPRRSIASSIFRPPSYSWTKSKTSHRSAARTGASM